MVRGAIGAAKVSSERGRAVVHPGRTEMVRRAEPVVMMTKGRSTMMRSAATHGAHEPCKSTEDLVPRFTVDTLPGQLPPRPLELRIGLGRRQRLYVGGGCGLCSFGRGACQGPDVELEEMDVGAVRIVLIELFVAVERDIVAICVDIS